MRRIDDDQRRMRLGVRHALAPGHQVSDPVSAARSVVALHGSDPATTVLSVLARAPGTTPAEVERTLYDDRALTRVLAMRRTVFAVPTGLATACQVSCAAVHADERRKLIKFVTDAGIPEAEAHVARVEAEALAVFDELETVTTKDLTAASELLASRVRIGTGPWAADASLASRALLILSARGDIVRARPRGGWTSSQFTWARSDRWSPLLAERPEPAEAATRLAETWLRQYGPATVDDLQWWTGWTKTRTRSALATLDTVEVDTASGSALVLADDVDPVAAPGPWVALLPALDPSAMGWKHRDHVLGPHKEQLFDVNGNAGPTVWADGRIVGGWVQRDDGEVVTHLLEDVGSAARTAIEQRAAELTEQLGDVRLKARARRWTPIEKLLRS